MEVQNSQPSPVTPTENRQTQTAAALSSDFETFLQMLTAQARYQDPLEPIDSSEYAAQLAQFSMVEQQVLSNDLLTELGANLGASNIGQMAGLIGLEARTSASVPYQGSPVTVLPPENADGADEAVLVVRSASGQDVARRQIPLGTDPYTWDGRDGTGSELAYGNYQFFVESRSAGAVLDTQPAESYARITEARLAGTDTLFVLQGGSEVNSNVIGALRAPQ